MSKESSIKVFAENASGTRPANAIPVWIDNISAIGGGGSGSDFDPTYMSAQIDNKLDSSALNMEHYYGINYVTAIDGTDISATYASTAQTANYDGGGNSLIQTRNNLTALNSFVQTNSANWEESITVSNSGDLYKIGFDGVDLYGYKSNTDVPNYVYSAVSSQKSNYLQPTPDPQWNNQAIQDLWFWSAFDIVSISSNGVQIYPPEAGDYMVTALDVYYNANYVFDYNDQQLANFSGYIGKITLDNLVISSYFDKPSYFDNIKRVSEFKLWFSANKNQGQMYNSYICSVGNKVQSGTSTIEGIFVIPQSDLPTYEYDSSNKISAINGSALAGGSDFDPTYMSAQIDNKLNKSEVGFRNWGPGYVTSISGRELSARYAQTAQGAYTAQTAYYDSNGNYLSQTYDNLTALNQFVQSNSANWEGGSSPTSDTVLFHKYSYQPSDGGKGSTDSFVANASDLYFEACVDSNYSSPNNIIIEQNGSFVGEAYWTQVSSDGSYNYYTASYKGLSNGEYKLNNNGSDYIWCAVSANGVRTQTFDQGTYETSTNKTVKFNVQGSNITGAIDGINHGSFTPLTSFTGNLSDFTAKGYGEYRCNINTDDYYNTSYYNISAEFEEGSTVASSDVFPPTNNLDPYATYYLGWNANNGGLFWYNPMEFVSTSSEATGANILYVVTGSN